MKTIVILGGGRITSALLAGLQLARYKSPIVVHDRNPGKLRQLQKLYGVVTEKDLHSAVAQAEILVIAVRPSSVNPLLRTIGPVTRPLSGVSLAAGIPLAKLSKLLGRPVRWARAMPSPVCRTGNGLTALSFERNFPPSDKKAVMNLFRKVGQVLEIPASRFDAFTVSYSCSHGYHALGILATAAEEIGLDRQTALIAASHALADGIVAWRKGNIRLEKLEIEAATPGGIAAAVMQAMGASGYKRAVKRGLNAGLRRAKKNSQHS